MLFDVSANGSPTNYNASPRDIDNWPRMLHIVWQVVNEKGQIQQNRNDLIKPQGFKVSPNALERHYLEASQLELEGIPVKKAIDAFMDAVKDVDMVLSHNLALHEGIVRAEADRCGSIDRLSSMDRYCLMQETTYYCAIPSKWGKYKWPSLTELHKKLFNRGYSKPGHADADLNAQARCFIVLYKTKILEDLFDN